MEQLVVKNWGNSQGIRLPKQITKQLNINVDDVLEVKIMDDMIVLKKTFKHKSQNVWQNNDGKIAVYNMNGATRLGGDALKELYQGEIIKIKGLKSYFIIVSKNEFIKFTG